MAAAATTGVSSTTVASRLSTAVVSDAATKVSVSMRRGSPRLALATRPPTAAKTPSAAQSSATTRMPARNATTGSSSRTWSSAPAASTAPAMTTAPAQSRPTSSSTHGGGCTKATTSITRRAPTARTSTTGAGTAEADAPRGLGKASAVRSAAQRWTRTTR